MKFLMISGYPHLCAAAADWQTGMSCLEFRPAVCVKLAAPVNRDPCRSEAARGGDRRAPSQITLIQINDTPD
jgi:hypothetical protein